MTITRTTDLPVACTLTAEERSTRPDVVRPLLSSAEEICELEDGYAFRFAAATETAAALLDLALFERRCCAFLTFELIFEPAQGPLWFQIRGSSPEAKEFAATFVS
jgi:hypothetical protein